MCGVEPFKVNMVNPKRLLKMEETTLEFYKDRGQVQENRILELQQRNKDSNINEQSIDLDYDLYLEHEYLFLNVNLPGFSNRN